MKIEVKHFGKVADNGNLSFYHLNLWDEQRFSLRGKEFELILRQKHQKPSINQFSYYFGCILGVCLTCEQFSHYQTREEIHKDVFSPLFLSYKIKVVVGKKSWLKDVSRSLADLSKAETSEFIQNVLNFCAQEGIVVPEAESYVEKHYREINLNKE